MKRLDAKSSTGLNQRKWALRAISCGALALATVARIALADSVSIRALDNGVDPFPESRFGARPFRERESREYRQTSQDRAPSRTPASDEWVPNRGDLKDQVSEFDAIEDRAPEAANVVAPKSQMTHAGPRGVQEVAVIANDLGFYPKMVFVNPDVPVRLYVTSSSKQALCIMMDSFQIRRQVRAMRVEEISFTPSTPGKFRFYCPVNGMEGTIVVREIVQDTTGPQSPFQPE